MVRKRVILLGISLGLLVNQFLLYEANRAVATDSSISAKISYDQEDQKQEYIGIGAILLKEPYNKKVIISDVISNGPSYRQLQPGMEIIKVNNVKVKKLSLSQTMLLIEGPNGSKVDLLVKDNNNKKQNIVITRGQYSVQKSTQDPIHDMYWLQYAPKATLEMEPINPLVWNRLSSRLKVEYGNLLAYWIPKKQVFDAGYQSCLAMSEGNIKVLHVCLQQLVNREVAKIEYEQEIARRRAELLALQQMQAQQNYAINNYANALRNQNVNHYGYVYQNVNHSGSINVNHDINGNLYLRRW